MFDRLPEEIQHAMNGLDLSLGPFSSAPTLSKRLNETLLLGGKKLRPALTFLMAGMIGHPVSEASTFARGGELVHGAFLAHDDVIDAADRRRNRPTVNALESNPKAVLAGDLLLGRVVVELSEHGNLAIIQGLARVVEDTVLGEWMQLEARGRVDITPEHLMEVGRRKTGGLFGWCAASPARNLGLSSEIVRRCEGLGEQVGIAYQMIDDTLDFASNPEKPYAKDLKEGLVNFVTLEMFRSRPALVEEIRPLLGRSEVTDWPWTDAELKEATIRVQRRAAALLQEGEDSLKFIYEATEGTEPLAGACLDSLLSLLAFFGGRTL